MTLRPASRPLLWRKGTPTGPLQIHFQLGRFSYAIIETYDLRIDCWLGRVEETGRLLGYPNCISIPVTLAVLSLSSPYATRHNHRQSVQIQFPPCRLRAQRYKAGGSLTKCVATAIISYHRSTRTSDDFHAGLSRLEAVSALRAPAGPHDFHAVG